MNRGGTFPGVVLVGFMGSGKSSVGRVLARRFGAPFVDVDERIEAAAFTAGQDHGQAFRHG